jgi:hypothetical protein
MTSTHAPVARTFYTSSGMMHLVSEVIETVERGYVADPSTTVLAKVRTACNRTYTGTMTIGEGDLDSVTCPRCRAGVDLMVAAAARLDALPTDDEPAEVVEETAAELEVPEYLRPALDAYGEAISAHGQTYGDTPACECGAPFSTRRGVGLHVSAMHKRAEREYTAAAAIARHKHRPGEVAAVLNTLAAQYREQVAARELSAAEVVVESERRAAAGEPVATLAELEETIAALDAPEPVHYTREQIAARFREVDEFVLILGPDDRAYDPETGDTLLGGVTVRYARGEFPGPAYTATIERPEADVPPAVEDRAEFTIPARELRASDRLVGPTGFDALSVFDTDAGTHIADGRPVRVWTAISDQERGLPPVVEFPADRELLVSRVVVPGSAEEVLDLLR